MSVTNIYFRSVHICITIVVLTPLHQWSTFLFNIQNFRGYYTALKIHSCTLCLHFLIRKLNVGQKPSVFENASEKLKKVAAYVRLFLAYFSLARGRRGLPLPQLELVGRAQLSVDEEEVC